MNFNFLKSKSSLIVAAAVTITVAVVGLSLSLSQAAGQFASIDPSKGTINGPARIVSNGIGGNAIQFGPTTPIGNVNPITYGRFLYVADSINSYQIQAKRWTWHSLQGNHTADLKGIKAVNKDAKVTVYATPAAARATDADGYTTAVRPSLVFQNNPSWILKDSAGNQIRRASNDDYAVDLGNVEYQKASLDFLLTKINRDGWDGVVLDEINPTPLYAFPGARPAKYPDDNSWKNATFAYVSHVCGGIRQAGKLCYINLGANDDWGKSVATLTTGAESEFFVALDPTYSNGQETATVENGLWLSQVAWAEWMENNLEQPLLHAATTKTALADYALGSYLLVTKGKGVFSSSLNYGNEGNVYTPTMDEVKKLGLPVSNRIEDVGGVWRREFQNGQVLVNPHANTRNYAGYTLNPTSAQFIFK